PTPAVPKRILVPKGPNIASAVPAPPPFTCRKARLVGGHGGLPRRAPQNLVVRHRPGIAVLFHFSQSSPSLPPACRFFPRAGRWGWSPRVFAPPATIPDRPRHLAPRGL